VNYQSPKNVGEKMEKKLKISEIKILVVGPNVWGRGDTLTEAIANASKPKQYIAYIVHPSTYVDGMGMLSYPGDYPPKEFHRHRMKEK
jgi:hypothetical protein